MPSPRILCYSPYTMWALHGQWEATILHGLRLRGADVRYVLCNGLYPECDMFWQATRPRDESSCRDCMSAVVELVESMGMPYEWLGKSLTMDERKRARRFADGLARGELRDAVHGDWEIARWIESSVHSHFRTSELDLELPEVERAFRGYLAGGLTAAFALSRLMDSYEPDGLFLFNGRMSSTRVAFEIARAKGVRVVTHERARRREHVQLVEDATVGSLGPWRRLREAWQDVPLVEGELGQVAAHLVEREHGKGVNWRTYNPPPQPVTALRERLALSPERPVWALFASSDDEMVADDEWRGAFPTQGEWVAAALDYARSHPELDLVIRVHPNTGGARSTGRNRGLLELFERLRGELPQNARMVMPDDDVSSYTLMEIASVGLVSMSTVGLELACKGKEVVVAGGNIVAGAPFVRTARDPGSFVAALDAVRTGPEPDAEAIRRLAHRFAYVYFFRADIPFPLVRMPDPHTGVLAYGSLEALVPGRDAGLDRACRVLADGEAPTPAPCPEELARDDADERAFFAPRPRVSVVVPCFNYGRYLEEAVASVLEQTFRDFEVIVVDDGSTDDSLAVARRLEAAHGQVRVLAQANSGQPAIARNNGIASARGEYVVCLDADDRIAPEFLEVCVDALDANPGAGIAYPAQQDFGDSERAWPHVDYSAEKLCRFNFIPTASLFRRAAWEAVGGYATNVRGYEDWDFWIGCAEHGFGGVPARGALWHYRIHGTSLYGDAAAVDPVRKAQVLLNHASLFAPEQLEWACSVLAGDEDAIAASGPVGIVPQPAPRRPSADAWEVAAEAAAGPFPGLSLEQALEAADALGYSAVAFEPAGSAWKRGVPEAERRVFPVPFLAGVAGAELDAARARVLARGLQDVLLGQALRGIDPRETPLDPARTARYAGVPAERLEEAAQLVTALGDRADAVEPEARPALAALARVLRSELVLRGDHAGARPVDRLAAALAAGPSVPGARSFVALAFADELLADPSLLAGYGDAFSGSDDATLAIVAGDAVDDLLGAVAAAGLDGDESADLLAIDAPVPHVHAVYSRREPPAALARLPRLDDVAELRRLAEQRWAA